MYTHFYLSFILAQAHGDPLKRLTCISKRMFKELLGLVTWLLPKGFKKVPMNHSPEAIRVDSSCHTSKSDRYSSFCGIGIDIRTRKALKPDWGLFLKSLDPDGEMEKEKELLVKRLIKGY